MAAVDDVLKGLGPAKVELEVEEPDDSDAGVIAGADELLSAIEAKDPAGVVSALRSLLAMLDVEPVEMMAGMGED